jgi:hypothetical protein
MTKSKKPTTVEGWEKVCSNLDAALHLSMQQENELIEAFQELKEKYDNLNTAMIKAAGIINYLEMKLERANSV